MRASLLVLASGTEARRAFQAVRRMLMRRRVRPHLRPTAPHVQPSPRPGRTCDTASTTRPSSSLSRRGAARARNSMDAARTCTCARPITSPHDPHANLHDHRTRPQVSRQCCPMRRLLGSKGGQASLGHHAEGPTLRGTLEPNPSPTLTRLRRRGPHAHGVGARHDLRLEQRVVQRVHARLRMQAACKQHACTICDSPVGPSARLAWHRALACATQGHAVAGVRCHGEHGCRGRSGREKGS